MGVFIQILTIVLTSLLRVALNKSVYLYLFAYFEISSITYLKPISKSLSASSKTKASISSRSKDLVFYKWSNILPEVPIIKSGYDLSSASCFYWLVLPI